VSGRRLGLLSALLGVASWPLLALALITGSLDSSGPVDPRVFVVPAGLSAGAAVILGLVALLRGPQRKLAALGLVVGIVFVLGFIGVVPWR
jgi:hypothetical protein